MGRHSRQRPVEIMVSVLNRTQTFERYLPASTQERYGRITAISSDLSTEAIASQVPDVTEYLVHNAPKHR